MKKILGSPIGLVEDLPEEEEIKINRKEHFSGDAWFLNPVAVANKATMSLSGSYKIMAMIPLVIIVAVVYLVIAVFGSACTGFFLFELLPNKIMNMYKSFKGVKED